MEQGGHFFNHLIPYIVLNHVNFYEPNEAYTQWG